MRGVHYILSVAFLSYTASAFGLAAEGTAGAIRYSVYAPDWTWQGRDANVMAVLENTGGIVVDCTVSLRIPEPVLDHFGHDGAPFTGNSEPLSASVSVLPGATRRIAVTGLTAMHGHPLQEYALEVTIRADDRGVVVPYPLQTIRGQAVSEGAAVALGVPIGVALLFSAAFAAVLRGSSRPDAWKLAGPPAEEPTEPEPWINTTPK